MEQNINKLLKSIQWKQATYYYIPIKNWYVSENGILYNIKTKEFKFGRDNVKGKDMHQRVSIKHKLYYISRIVAEAFVNNENPEINVIVRHLDDNPLNNHYSNLKWGTYKENTNDAIINKKIIYDENRNYTRCEEHPASILTNEDVMFIIGLLNNKVLLKDIAKKFHVDVDVIRHIYKGKSWIYLTKDFLPFPKQELLRKPLDPKIKKSIIDYLDIYPLSKPSEIISELGLEPSNTIKGFIGSIKRKNKL